MKKSKLLVFIVIAAAIAAFFIFDLKQYFSLDYFKSQQAAIGPLMTNRFTIDSRMPIVSKKSV